jgi:hypothetical protein
MQQAALILSGLLALGCGGRAANPDSGAHKGGQAPVAGGGSAPIGGDDQAPAGAGGHVTEDYVPVAPAPFNDMHLSDGSFEEAPGFGWDRCFTKTPGSVMQGEVDASNGDYFVELTTSTCRGTCSEANASDSQLYVWFGEGKHPTAPAGLYLDLINLAEATPDGRFSLYAVDASCETLRPLFDLPLSALSLTRNWSTRCFDIALDPDEGLGLAVHGPQYHLGLDALRLGPACGANP